MILICTYTKMINILYHCVFVPMDLGIIIDATRLNMSMMKLL